MESDAQAESSKFRKNCSVLWLMISGFMEMGLVSGLSLASHLTHAHIWSSSGPFLLANASLRQDGSQSKGFWEVGRTYYGLAPPPSFWFLPNSSGWFWQQLVSSEFLTSTSCCEIAYASGYFHAWPR